MKVVFFGTPDYVIPVLDALKSAGHDITAVVTQPPKPVGRKQELTPSPVAEWAQKHGIQVLDGEPKPLKKLAVQVGILEAYGRILPPELLDALPHGIINVHPSLLPKYRGTSPVAAAIAAGERQTGATIMKLDEEMDHGPILAQFTEDIKPEDTSGSLRERLFKMGAEVLVEILPAYLEGRAQLREQDHSKATYTTLIKKEHGFIPPEYLAAALKGDTLRNQKWEIGFIKDYTQKPTPEALERFVRALYPWPGAWSYVQIQRSSAQAFQRSRLKILKAHVEDEKLVLDQVQLEGKKTVSWRQFRQGYPEARF